MPINHDSDTFRKSINNTTQGMKQLINSYAGLKPEQIHEID